MTANSEQIEFWNGEGGERWARLDDHMEVLLQPICERLLEQAVPRAGECAVDIGCGCFSLSTEARNSTYLYVIRDIGIFALGLWVLFFKIQSDRRLPLYSS